MTKVDRQSRVFESEINLQYVQAELIRIDVSIRRAVYGWQAAGQDPKDIFRGLAISDAEASQVASLPFGSSWGQAVLLPPAEELAFQNSLQEAGLQAERLLIAARERGIAVRLDLLKNAFTLTPFEYDAFLICLAPALDLRYERLYAYLQDDITRKQPTINLILNLLSAAGPQRLLALVNFASDRSLLGSHLLERISDSSAVGLLGQALQVDPAVTSWLLGHYQPHAALGGYARLIEPADRAVDRLLTTHTVDDLELTALLSRHNSGNPPVLAFSGPDRTAQDAAARLIGACQGRSLLQVDLANVILISAHPPLEALHFALRDARLTGAIPYLTGWETCLGSAGQSTGQKPPTEEILANLFAFEGLVIVAGQAAWQTAGIERDRPVFYIEFPLPAFIERRALWEHFLGQASSQPVDDGLELTALAGQFALNGGQIRDAVNSARDLALQENITLAARHLFAAARLHSSATLGGLARKIEPRYTWADIILPDDQLAMLHELVSTVRGRPVVLDQWGVGEKLVASSGIPILFSGQPGTGKTMAAEVVANEMGLDLYKIDISTVVSKFIGETEKNLELIFNEAESSNAILFFDEADAIFGKRSEVKDAHDRYANIEISYLLQRMERYNGVTILATNLRANLDEAFTRRLQFSVDFPFPGEEHRLRIWQTLFPPDVPRAPDLDLGLLARRFKLAGGNIRNILVSAAYLAAEDGGWVTMEHLLHGARRELQKMGRLVNEADLVTR
jgi:hypothetical protein